MVHFCLLIQDHDASESAAAVAASLLSYARVVFGLDSVLTEYSAQYLMDNACPNKVDGQDHRCSNLTVTDCLLFALNKGIPKADQPSPSSIAPMEGKVIVTDNVDVALMFVQQQPVGAKMHVFNPELDYLIEDRTDSCPRGISRYVGLRDVVICKVDEVDGEKVAMVKIFYKKKFEFIKVSLDTMVSIPKVGEPAHIARSTPERLLFDFCLPRLCNN